MELKLENGRPETNEEREEKEIRVYDMLDELGVSYQRVDHEAAFTMEACEEIDGTLQAMTCKNLFLCNRQKTKYYLLLIPGDKVFKTKELSKQIGSARLSFGSPEAMEEMLGVTPGSATIMGLMNDPEHKVQLLVDEDVLKEEEFGCHPCVNTSSLRLKTADVFGKVLEHFGHEMVKVHLVGEE